MAVMPFASLAAPEGAGPPPADGVVCMAFGAMSFSGVNSRAAGSAVDNDIFALRRSHKMDGVDTCWVVASVVHNLSVWDVTLRKHVCHAVGNNELALSDTKCPVAVTVKGCCPQPARASFVNFLPEPFFNWASRVWHGKSIPQNNTRDWMVAEQMIRDGVEMPHVPA